MVVERMRHREASGPGRPRIPGVVLIVGAAVLGTGALGAFLSVERPSAVFAALGAPPGSAALENFSHRDQDGMTAEQDHGEFTTTADRKQILAFYRTACRHQALSVAPSGAASLPLGFARSELVCRGNVRGERYTAAIDTRCHAGGCRIFIDVVTD